MASIHPSRLGMVPVPQNHPLPPRPTVSSAPSSSGARDGRVDDPASREEELRRRLMARRSGRGREGGEQRSERHEEAVGQRRDEEKGSDGYRGKELISEEPVGAFGILGRAKRDALAREEGREEPAAREEGREEPAASRGHSEGAGSERGYDRPRSSPSRGGRDDSRDEDRPPRRPRRLSLERDDRQRSLSRDAPDWNSPRRDEPRDRRGFVHPERLRLQEQHPDRRTRYPDDRGYSRSPRRYDGDHRRDVGGFASQPLSREDSLSHSRHPSRRPSPSYRPHDLPPRPPREGPLPSQDQARPSAPWMNAPSGMPAFPPNKRLTPADLEQRRAERDRMTFSIWPPSPPHPWRDPDEVEEERRAKRKDRRKAKKSKRRSRYSDSETESSDSEYERKRRKTKERQREKERAREQRYSDEEDSVDEERRKRRRSRTRTRSRERSSTLPRRDTEEVETEPEVEGEEELWVEKGAGARRDNPEGGSGEEGEDVGPKLPLEHTGRDRFKTHYTNMLYGEAEAMAAYAADGKRIPRRGEIGLDAEKIEAFEAAGYVMSGSRHKRMTAVRLRKENQVINAEEKRAILKLQREEKVRKEGAIVSQFREMLEEKLREGKEER